MFKKLFSRSDQSNDTPVAEKDKVPLKEKLAYGAGAVSMGIQERFDNQVINPIFLVGVGIEPYVMSIAGGIYRIWDAFTDMLMGWISDNTRSRWGRRRPYLFIGAILMGLAMPWLFFYNPAWPVAGITGWMIAFSLVLYLTLTIYNVPYQAILTECTPDTNERTNVASWRAFVGIFTGILVSWTWTMSQWPVFHVDGEPDVLHGIRWLVCIAIIPVVLLGVLPAIFMKERFYKVARTQKKIPLKNSLKYTLTNRPFVALLVFAFIMIGGGGLHWSLVFYLRLYFVCEGDQVLAAEISGWQGTMQAIIGILGIPLARWLALKIGKMPTLFLGQALAFTANFSTYFLMTPETPYLSIIPFVLLGPINSIIWVMIPSMIGDVADYDEWKNGERAEGAFSAVFSWIVKLAQSTTILSGFVVTWAGYEAATRHELAQNFEVLENMRFLTAALPSTFVLISLVALFYYPLNARRIREIRTDLENRRGEV